MGKCTMGHQQRHTILYCCNSCTYLTRTRYERSAHERTTGHKFSPEHTWPRQLKSGWPLRPRYAEGSPSYTPSVRLNRLEMEVSNMETVADPEPQMTEEDLQDLTDLLDLREPIQRPAGLLQELDPCLQGPTPMDSWSPIGLSEEATQDTTLADPTDMSSWLDELAEKLDAQGGWDMRTPRELNTPPPPPNNTPTYIDLSGWDFSAYEVNDGVDL